MRQGVSTYYLYLNILYFFLNVITHAAPIKTSTDTSMIENTFTVSPVFGEEGFEEEGFDAEGFEEEGFEFSPLFSS